MTFRDIINCVEKLFETGALLAFIINYKKLLKTPFKSFFPLLIIMNTIEWGSWFKIWSINFNGVRTNNWIYNIYHIVEIAFYAWFFFKNIDAAKEKKRVQVLYLIVLLLSLIDIIFVQRIESYNSYAYIVGGCYVVYCVYLYFRQIIKNVGAESISKNGVFWVSIGSLFFFSGQAFLLSFYEYFKSINDFPSFQPVFFISSCLLIIILYTCLSISFFCKPQQQNK
jgi:hypothetical protein